MDKLSYALGINIGHQLRGMGLEDTFAPADFAAGVEDMIKGGSLKISIDDAQKILNDFFTDLENKQKSVAAEAGKKAKSEGEAFLKENAQKLGVISTPSGLQYEVLVDGYGRKPKSSDTVRCHYEGRLLDGTIFDSSYRRNAPADFGLKQVIAGWTEGVQLMKEGAKYRFYIPYNLAYGEQGAGNDIPPFATLIFDVELLKIL